MNNYLSNSNINNRPHTHTNLSQQVPLIQWNLIYIIQQQHQPQRQVKIVTTSTKPPQPRTLTPSQDIVGAIGLLLKTEHHATVETLKAGNTTAAKDAKSQHERVTDQLSDMKQQIMSLQSASQKLIQAAQVINQRAYNIEQALKTMQQTIHQNRHYVHENRIAIKNLPDYTMY